METTNSDFYLEMKKKKRKIRENSFLLLSFFFLLSFNSLLLLFSRLSCLLVSTGPAPKFERALLSNLERGIRGSGKVVLKRRNRKRERERERERERDFGSGSRTVSSVAKTIGASASGRSGLF